MAYSYQTDWVLGYKVLLRQKPIFNISFGLYFGHLMQRGDCLLSRLMA